MCFVKIMVTRQRTDLHMNIPALRKLDAMLIVRTLTFQTYTHIYCYICLFCLVNVFNLLRSTTMKWAGLS